MTEKSGENSIILNGGANMVDNSESLDESWREIISQSNVLLLQREIPERLNILAARCAKEVQTHEIIVILDMGGIDEPVSRELIHLCDIVSPNETEAKRLFNSEEGEEEDAKTAESNEVE